MQTSSGAAVRVTGEFVGSASKFGVWEDALAVLYPVTKKTSTMLRAVVWILGKTMHHELLQRLGYAQS